VTDLETLDKLARLQLAAKRLGLELRLSHASRELIELIQLAGLSDVLGVDAEPDDEQSEGAGFPGHDA